jgi:AcrR family transcriptional regulator
MSPSRRELVDATHARILAAAARLSRERGVGRFSMDELAREAGVARATVYEHFRSKRAVLDELTSRSARDVAPGDVTEGAPGEPLAVLRNALRGACRHWAEHEADAQEARTLAAITGSDQGVDLVPAGLDKVVDALASTGHLRSHWSPEEAVAALSVLTSFDTYERLRGDGERSQSEIEAVLAKLAIAVIAPPAQNSGPGSSSGSGSANPGSSGSGGATSGGPGNAGGGNTANGGGAVSGAAASTSGTAAAS